MVTSVTKNSPGNICSVFWMARKIEEHWCATYNLYTRVALLWYFFFFNIKRCNRNSWYLYRVDNCSLCVQQVTTVWQRMRILTHLRTPQWLSKFLTIAVYGLHTSFGRFSNYLIYSLYGAQFLSLLIIYIRGLWFHHTVIYKISSQNVLPVWSINFGHVQLKCAVFFTLNLYIEHFSSFNIQFSNGKACLFHKLQYIYIWRMIIFLTITIKSR